MNIKNHTQSLMSEAFEGTELPTLVYAARQDYGTHIYLRPMHRHQSICEIALCFRGFATAHINGLANPVQPGDALYFNREDIHEIVSDYEVEVGLYVFGFSGIHLRGLPENHIIPADSPHVRPSQQSFPFLCDLAEQILQKQNGGTINRLTAQFMSISLLLTIAALPAITAESGTGTVTMAGRIQEYIDQHFTEPITLQRIAEAMSCSTDYVAHTFKNATGYSPIQYVIRCRIGLAQNLLISSDYSATHIASLVGYDNSNYFNALFSRIVGIPPIQYRKKYLELYGEQQLL
ncbi:MAG: AraC family transcriptional regulator [Butyricicoccaceae bacterium]